MNRNKLLVEQIQKHLPRGLAQRADIASFLNAVDRSYNSFERDRDLLAHASAHRLSQLIKNLNSAILVEDEQRTIVLANQLFCDIFSVPLDPEQMTGMDCAQSTEMSKSLFVDPQGFMSRIDEILRARQLVTGDELAMTDGRVLLRDFIPIFIGEEFKGHLWKLQDVTREKESQRELQRLSMVASANENGVVFTDQAGVISWTNEGFVRLTGYSREEIVGRTPIELCRGPLTVKESLHEMLDAFYAGRNFISEVVHYRKDGSWFWGKATGQSVLDEQGRVLRYFAIIEDITKNKMLELDLIEAKEAAEQSSRAKEVFLANMSHEIRTPMNAILGMGRQLHKSGLDSRQRRYLDTINAAGENLLVVINDILDISKIEAGQLTLERIGFKLGEVIERVVRVMLHKAEEKGLQLTWSLDNRISPVLLGDPYRLNQVVLNLTSNAIKFTDRGSVDIRCSVLAEEEDRQSVRIVVRDTGIGMEKEFLGHLFQKFQQEDRSVARKFGGTGLGMSICKHLTGLMHGDILVTSVKGEGTSVILTIPFEYGKEADLPQKAAQDTDSGVLGNKNILLVEDNEMNRLVATTILQGYGVTVTEAFNGEEALKQLRSGSFDLVLMDVQMPVMDGFEATRVIRREIDPGIPIIALTANAIKGESLKCLSAGMNAYISKPFEEEDLIRMIAYWLNKGRSIADADAGVKDAGALNGAPAALYDLDRLKQIGRGDEAFEHRMVSLFLDQAPASAVEMKEALGSGDGPRLYAVAHRLKPMLHNFGIACLAEDMKDIGKLALEQPLSASLERLLAHVAEVIGKVVQRLTDSAIQG
jgi:PAS domain S-box-containing protein